MAWVGLIVLFLAGCGTGFTASVKPKEASSSITPPPEDTQGGGGIIGGNGKTGGANPYACAAGSDPGTRDLRRLSRREYLLTLQSLTNGYADLSQIADQVNLLPADTVSNVFDSTDASVSIGHIEAYLGIAREISAQLIAKPEWIRSVVNCEYASGMTDTCWSNFFNGFAARVYRKPLSSQEQADLKALFATEVSYGVPAGLQAVTMALLQSPNFLYKVEVAGSPLNGREDILKMNDYETASRLAFLATGRGPDAILMEEARNGRLATPEGLKTAVQRLFSSAEARENVEEFYMQWLGAKRLPSSTHSDWFLAGVSRGAIAPESLQELRDLTSDLTWTKAGGYKDLLVSETSFVKGQALGTIYNGQASLPSGQRPGVLSRTAFLLSATNQTSLVHRGLLVRRNLLCDKIIFPTITDENRELFQPPKPNPLASLREQIETRTAVPQCMACHSKLNPMGFVLENYDALGRYQTEEKVFDANGNILARHSINARVRPNIESEDEPEVDGLAQMSEAIAASSKGPACAAQQWFTFVEGREPRTSDSCSLSTLFDSLMDKERVSPSGDAPGTLLNMMKASAFESNFRVRKVGPQN